MYNPNVRQSMNPRQLTKLWLSQHLSTLRIPPCQRIKEWLKLLDATLGKLATRFSRRYAITFLALNRKCLPGTRRWLTTDEQKSLDVLASLIVPTDEIGPGAKEANVVDSIELLLANSLPKQVLYVRGLASIDDWSNREHGCRFVRLTTKRQANLLRHIEQLGDNLHGTSPLITRIKNRLSVLYYEWIGLFPAVTLVPILVRDVLHAFYTSQICWDWLNYDGPPMPDGYPDLLVGRLPLRQTESATQFANGDIQVNEDSARPSFVEFYKG